MNPLLLSLLLGFQVPAPAPLRFETVSVTRGRSDRGVKGGCHGTDSVFTPHQMADAPPPGQCVITDARLSHLLMIASASNGLSRWWVVRTGPVTEASATT